MHKLAINHKQAIIGGGYLFTENACCSFFVLRNTYGQYTSGITSPLHNDSKYGFLCYRYWQFCWVFHWDLYSFFGPSSLCSFNIDDKKCLIPEIIFNLNSVWQGFLYFKYFNFKTIHFSSICNCFEIVEIVSSICFKIINIVVHISKEQQHRDFAIWPFENKWCPTALLWKGMFVFSHVQ